jgi:hypothetical protein
MGAIAMKHMMIALKIALFLVAFTALLYWREVWGWVSAKTWNELAGDILGFALKWFYLAIFGFLANTIPHYVTPWLKLLRRKGQMQLRQSRHIRRFSRKASHPETSTTRHTKDVQPPEIKIRF